MGVLGVVANRADMDRMILEALAAEELTIQVEEIEPDGTFRARSSESGQSVEYRILDHPYRDEEGKLRVKVERHFEGVGWAEGEVDLTRFGFDPVQDEAQDVGRCLVLSTLLDDWRRGRSPICI